ncbi:MAG TPA: PAS domain-containing protein, partial [Polyangiales bacterium]|nr:PAS domain-containing protein [Polyangiales bacterium]
MIRATHGTEALALLRDWNFAVILMDVRMPDLDGFEVTRLAREAGDRTPVIFVTATPEDALVTRRGYAGGGVDFMVKPFDADILRWKVRAFVEIWQRQEQLRRETAAHKAELDRGRLAGLLAQSPAAIAITRGSDYVFEFVNPLFEKVMGRKIELGSTLGANLPELTTQPRVMGALQQVLSSGESFVGREFEMLIHRGPDGALERVFFDLVFQPVRDSREEVTHVLTHAVEVTEHVRAREHLRESEQRFRALTEALPLLVYSARAEGGAPDYYNSRWYEYTGLPVGSLDADAWERVCHPEDLPAVRAKWQQSHVSGAPFESELRLRRADGAYRWHLARSAPLHDVDGRVTRWLGTSTDIDEQKRAHDVQEFLADVSVELSTSLDYETTLQRVAKLVVPRFADWCAVDVLDERGAVQRLAVEHLDPEKVALAHELHRRYPPDLQAEHGLAAVLRTGKSEWMVEIPDALLVASVKDPEQLRIARELGLKSYITVPLKRGARVFGAITVVQAESERRYSASDLAVIEEMALRASLAIENARLFRKAEQLNETLEHRVRERTQELEEANRELESFSYSVSHDLRAPLRHITGFAQLLEKRAQAQLDETSRKYVQTISTSAQQGGKLVDDLLSFSRMGRSELKKSSVPLSQVVNQARKDLEPETHDRR